ncbi:MAG: hypothetical protein ABSG59_18345 [Verrucomicrobiota bacterium]|jgi:hypothetical protein
MNLDETLDLIERVSRWLERGAKVFLKAPPSLKRNRLLKEIRIRNRQLGRELARIEEATS